MHSEVIRSSGEMGSAVMAREPPTRSRVKVRKDTLARCHPRRGSPKLCTFKAGTFDRRRIPLLTRLPAQSGGHAREKAAFPTSFRRGLAEQLRNHKVSVSAQDAQCAAMREVSTDCKPRPPKCSGSCCALLVARGPNNGGESLAKSSRKQPRTASSWLRAKGAVEEGGKAQSN